MSNYHLRDMRLSLKARGLLSQILSLPEKWDMTISGLSKINRECSDTIASIIKELEATGYITRYRERRKNGTYGEVFYDIRMKPRHFDEPKRNKSERVKPKQMSSAQLSKEKSNKEKESKELFNIHQSILPDGIDKIEVKSYTGEIRKHTFSLDQLYTTENSQLVIASIQVIQTGLGMNVYELMDRISLKIQDDITLLIHLRNIIMATVGKYFNEVAEYRFDYEISSESYALFDSLDIPKIDKTLVLPEISNVHFTVDFSGLFPIDSQSKSSTLINAL